jgi:hypothetical protein
LDTFMIVSAPGQPLGHTQPTEPSHR